MRCFIRAFTITFFIFAVFLVHAASVNAATIYSNSATGNDTTGDGSSGNPFKTFHKAYTTAAANDTINLTGTFTWSDADETGDASVTGYTLGKNLTITGQSASSTIIQAASSAGTADRRIFYVASSVTVTIKNLTMRYGHVTANPYYGGCAAFLSGIVTLQYVSVTECRTSTGNNSGDGGALVLANGTTTVENSSFRNNSAPFSSGGAIYIASGKLIATNSTFTGNYAADDGGAITGNGNFSALVTNITVTNNASGKGGGFSFGPNDPGTPRPNITLKNSIIASNTASSSYPNDIYLTTGRIYSNGYNIVGQYTTPAPTNQFTFTPTTGDWTDTDADGTYTLYSAGTTGTLSLASAAADAAYGTYVHALQSGSIGINHGSNVANATTTITTVAIPSADQVGTVRSGDVDIGAYEFNGVADSTPPVISSIASSTTATTATVTWSTDEAASSVVDYGLTSSYGSTSSSGTLTTSHSRNITGLSAGTLYHFRISSTDSSSNVATSSDRTFTTATEDVAPSSLSATTTSSTSTITWTTAEGASSQVFYGPQAITDAFTTETDTSPRVTSHSVSIGELPSCTTFYYVVTGAAAGGTRATSTQSTFTTGGCVGSTSIISSSAAQVATSSGGTVTQDSLTLTIPINFTATSSAVTFQLNKISSLPFFSAASVPASKVAAATPVVNIKALTTATTTLTTFSQPIIVTFAYTLSEISGLKESTLTIYRYSNSAWNALSNCQQSLVARTVSCQTTGFSDFALFGEPNVHTTGGGTLVSNGDGTWRLPSGEAYAVPPAAPSAPIPPSSPSATNYSFTKNLKLGMTDAEVLALQKFLNAKGYAVSQSGPGSAGSETDMFGRMTASALARFQKDNNITPASGYFGPLTRALINSLSGTPVAPQAPSAPLPPSTVPIVDLELGSEGEDVIKLQEYLISKGYDIPSGATGYYGGQTKAALIRYQKDNNITPAAGYFGARTRAKMGNE